MSAHSSHYELMLDTVHRSDGEFLISSGKLMAVLDLSDKLKLEKKGLIFFMQVWLGTGSWL